MAGNRNRHRLVLRLEGLYRRLFMLFWASRPHSFLVTEYPKSGGSWLTTMVAELAGVDFPRNRFPCERRSAFQGHYLRSYGQKNVIVLWRDPRDIVISYYFHAIIGNSHTNPAHTEAFRKACGIVEPENIQKELPKFIRYMFSGKMSPRFTWSDFFDRWHGAEGCLHVSYEELRSSPAAAMTRISEYLSVDMDEAGLRAIIDKHSFEKQTGRKPGEENQSSFARKGLVGDWVSYFTDEAVSVFNECVGQRPTKLGYLYE